MPKIYLAYPKDGESDSPELRALGLKFTKAAPFNVPFIGLRTLEQPGYESYIHHLPGFMFATDTNERQRLSKVGFPIRTPISKCFPIQHPPVILRIESGVEEIKGALDKIGDFYTTTQRKEGAKTVTDISINAGVSTFPTIRRIASIEFHPPSGKVGTKGYLAFLLALRIFSSFFRAHTYPAYTTPTDEEDYRGKSDRITEITGVQKKRRVELEDGTIIGEQGGAPLDEEMDVEEGLDKRFAMRFAKPSDTTIKPWGDSPNDAPTAHGIVFPFVTQLQNWDKDMVPQLMNDRFLRCFGDQDTSMVANFNAFAEGWKNQVHSTHAGAVLSHMAKVISIALPAQARPFPLFEGEMYKGMYLYGANFSVAFRGTIIRPTPFDQNRDDIELLYSLKLFRKEIEETVSDDTWDALLQSDPKSLRDYHNFLLERIDLTPDTIEALRVKAAGVVFGTTYEPPTVANVQVAVLASLKGEVVSKDSPMHYAGFLSNSVWDQNLSMFGPLVPTPHIPGGKEISDFSKVPDRSSVKYRRCVLHSAVAEWKDAMERGSVRNEPTNQSAQFQYVNLTGKKEKEAWYESMKHLTQFAREMRNKGVEKDVVIPAKMKDNVGLDDLF